MLISGIKSRSCIARFQNCRPSDTASTPCENAPGNSDKQNNPAVHLRAMTVKQVSKLAQRVQREATGYYCGYTFKGQPADRKHIAAAAKSLDYLTTGLEDKTEGQRLHRATHRRLIDMQHRCMTRAAEEKKGIWLRIA